MSFQKKEIQASYLGVIDIGTYKIRVGICKILNRNIELIGYGEKRQNSEDIYIQEIKNPEGVLLNIDQAIQKAETDAKRKVNDFIINLPTSNIFFESSTVDIKRETNTKIDEYTLYELLKELESSALKKQYKKIKNSSGYSKSELKIIINNINAIQADGRDSKNLIGSTAKDISLQAFNIFINKTKYNFIHTIEKFGKKNILQLVPTEYALMRHFEGRKELVILDIGNSHTSLVVKKNHQILGAKKLALGIDDLFKQIQKNHAVTKMEMIAKIDTGVFQEEKKEFLEIFIDILSISLEDILRYEVCPHNFFLAGGGANEFIKDCLAHTDLNKNNLKITKNIQFVSHNKFQITDKVSENTAWKIESKSNINIFTMIEASLDFTKKRESKIEKILKKILQEIA